MTPTTTPLLTWAARGDGGRDAYLGWWPDDGVRFSLEFAATCHRRGRWRLLVEVCGGPAHYRWGCFDADDQPMRYYHDETRALAEAEAIAAVLWAERLPADPAGGA